MDPREALAVAKVLLTNGPGWGKGQMSNAETGKVCLIGAIQLAYGGYVYSNYAESLVSRWLGAHGKYWQIWQFNDHPTTKLKDVLNLLDKVINDAS